MCPAKTPPDFKIQRISTEGEGCVKSGQGQSSKTSKVRGLLGLVNSSPYS